MGLPPASHPFVDSIPLLPTGGNIDNKRIGVGTTMFYPVEVAGGLLSMGDAHTAQGDSELDSTVIETSITGKFKVEVIKQVDFNAWQMLLDDRSARRRTSFWSTRSRRSITSRRSPRTRARSTAPRPSTRP
mmetsp:Transcript_91/g.307  ORF Transcript_91/g.307 Transcript_91/m.307 type:complete len:131 (-) Transcript_91:387-779(-)